MTLSPTGLAYLKRAEGFKPELYPDAGKWAIGYGCQVDPAEWQGRKITEPEADALLKERLRREFEPAVNEAVTVSLEQHQFDALVCLAYNIGAPAFRGSTLVRHLNDEKPIWAANQFPKWRYSQGVISKVLVARRKRELTMFLGEKIEA